MKIFMYETNFHIKRTINVNLYHTSHFQFFFALVLLLSCDIEINPGPTFESNCDIIIEFDVVWIVILQLTGY